VLGAGGAAGFHVIPKPFDKRGPSLEPVRKLRSVSLEPHSCEGMGGSEMQPVGGNRAWVLYNDSRDVLSGSVHGFQVHNIPLLLNRDRHSASQPRNCKLKR
jgi:hypothetical protein